MTRSLGHSKLRNQEQHLGNVDRLQLHSIKMNNEGRVFRTRLHVMIVPELYPPSFSAHPNVHELPSMPHKRAA